MTDDEDDGFCPLCQRRPVDAEGICGVCFERAIRSSTLDQWDQWGVHMDASKLGLGVE